MSLEIYRITVRKEWRERFLDLLDTIRPGENKIRTIMPGNVLMGVRETNIFDLSLHEDEFMLIKLSIHLEKEDQIKEWWTE